MERIDSYIKIEQEPKPTEGGQPPAYWPASGDLRVENLSARYSSVSIAHVSSFYLTIACRMDLKFCRTCLSTSNQVNVLVSVCHGLASTSYSIANPKLVGRTGSGKVMCICIVYLDLLLTVLKSSLTLSLLRCIFTEGNVYYDGIPTSGINLDALRSNVTIIPQIVRSLCRCSFRSLTRFISCSPSS